MCKSKQRRWRKHAEAEQNARMCEAQRQQELHEQGGPAAEATEEQVAWNANNMNRNGQVGEGSPNTRIRL